MLLTQLPFYANSTVIKEADYEDDKDDIEDVKEPKNDETERKVIVKEKLY